ncbi:MAG: thioredoxin [Chloroflexi bacterium]|nr:thioredoxin [Chloroflexota bacterium]
MPLNTNDQSVDRVLSSSFPVALVLWNGTKLDSSLDETLRQVARDDAGRLIVAKLNAQENPQTAARFNDTLPGLLIFRNGQETTRASRITSASFRQHIDHLLGRGPAPAAESPAQQDQARPASKPVTVNDSSFQRDVLDSDLPVLVDLWAEWCPPCRMIAPIVEKFAGEYAGRLKVAKLNVDENPYTSSRFQVQSIPTLLLFRNGKVIERIVGAAPEPLLRGKIDAALR